MICTHLSVCPSFIIIILSFWFFNRPFCIFFLLFPLHFGYFLFVSRSRHQSHRKFNHLSGRLHPFCSPLLLLLNSNRNCVSCWQFVRFPQCWRTSGKSGRCKRWEERQIEGRLTIHLLRLCDDDVGKMSMREQAKDGW